MKQNSLRLYYKNQLELSYALKEYIDSYFKNEIQENAFEKRMIEVVNSNKDKLYRGDEFTKKPKQILGKVRLDLIKKIMIKNSIC